MIRNALALSLLALPLALPAQPLQTRNEAALSRYAALPVMGVSTLAPAGVTVVGFNTDLTNEFYAEDRGGESTRIDGETWRHTLQLRRRLGPSVELGLRASLIGSGGGFMDRFIEDWHRVFGLPNGGRENFPQDRFGYALVKDGQTLLDVRERGTGLGDVEAEIGFALRPGQVLRVMAKLPTGDRDRLQGGHWGGALWLDNALPFTTGSPWQGHYSVGVSAQETAGALAERQRPVTALGSVGLSRVVWGPLSLLGQLNAHTSLYRGLDTDVGNPGLQLALGGRWQVNPRWQLDLAFQEDLITHASPDFSLHAALRFQPEAP